MTRYPHILLFLKAPRPGFVKTRLAADLGDEAACRVYRHLAEQTLSQLPPTFPITVYFTPADAEEEMRDWLGHDLKLVPQVEGDLGQRLAAASHAAFEAGAPGVIFLGGDCPGVTSCHLSEAAQSFTENSPVIGPAKDGGYWLLGLHQPSPEVFQNISWSTGTVYTQTLAQLATLDLEPHQLEVLEDVDDLPSYQRARAACPILDSLI